ncbi:MAG: PIN domain-containing protein [Defluviitaleaceae bacterium]|nr:PIN domain-containing protein [Defluviitaleaceae bacterium]
MKEEVGDDVVKEILKQAREGKTKVYMNKLNLFEVFYGIRRAEGLPRAKEVYDTIMKLPIQIIDGISDDVFLEASRIKASYRMSLADSIALAQASVMGAFIVTSDHHEFDIVEQNESIKFAWIR